MRKFIISFILLFASLFFPALTHAQTGNFMTILSPNGGESYNVGEPVNIRWTTNATSNCSIYYQTEVDGPFTSYFIGSVPNGSVGEFDWQASVPAGSNGDQREKVNVVCAGAPTDYSDDFFTVSAPSPTPTPTPTPAPVCNRLAQVSLQDVSTPSVTAGSSVNNTVVVTNPNDAACGGVWYGSAQSYPPGWSLQMSELAVFINGGETKYIPITVTSSSTAAVGDYSYTVYMGSGTYVGATGQVHVMPTCNLTVQASLLDSVIPSVYPGDTVNNQLHITNPNPASCGANTYLISRGFPLNWLMTVPNSVEASGSASVNVPFSLHVASNSAAMRYNYDFTIYNSWADGSGQASVNGNVDVLPTPTPTPTPDTLGPSVSIVSPLNGSLVNKNSTVNISVNANDNVGVTRVEIYVDGVLKCNDTLAPYSCSFAHQ